MKWKIIVPVAAAAIAAIIAVSIVTAGSNAPTSPNAQGAAPGIASGTASGAVVLPVSSNPITNTSTAPGLVLVSAEAENNVDPATGQPTADRLQVELKNTSSGTLSGFEIFYTMTDAKTQKSESYYLPLTGMSLAAGAKTTVFFDNQNGPNHFPENKFSIYRSSKNQVDFTIEVSAKGVAVAKGTATKGAGTGEVVGG